MCIIYCPDQDAKRSQTPDTARLVPGLAEPPLRHNQPLECWIKAKTLGCVSTELPCPHRGSKWVSLRAYFALLRVISENERSVTTICTSNFRNRNIQNLFPNLISNKNFITEALNLILKNLSMHPLVLSIAQPNNTE